MAEIVTPTKANRDVSLPTMILATKLYIPSPRPNLVPRPHLIEQLNNTLRVGHKLTLLSASPGFGKTTLLSEWINGAWGADKAASDQSPKIAWVSLDKDDNNPQRFLTYCVAALQEGIQSEVGQSALEMLTWPNLQSVTPAMFVTALINEAKPSNLPLIFVFDDYHVISSNLIHDSVAFLVDNLPAEVHVVISTRTDPPFPLGRLRGRGQLIELNTADLRFKPAEVASFLNQTMGLNLSTAEVTALENRTEGWITGLQMVALSMRGLKDASTFVKAFTGSHRYILDYLLEEVLNLQPEAVQNFLLQTSILNRLSGPLCDAVVGQLEIEDWKLATGKAVPLQSQQILEYLEQGNLFILPLDDQRGWYRYHHLFAELLRHRLEQEITSGEGAVDSALLHRRASAWYEQNGLLVDAISHALSAVDVERVVRLARQKAETMLSRTESVTLLRWIDTLPQALNRSRPRLSLFRAWAMLLTGELQAVEAHLEKAEQELRADGLDDERVAILGEIATLRGGVAHFERDMSQAIPLYQQALEYIPTHNQFLRGIVWQCLGAACSWRGDVVGATQAYTEAGHVSQSRNDTLIYLISLWNLGQLYREQGYLHQAAAAYHEGLKLFEQQNEAAKESLLPFVGRLHIGLAGLMYHWNDLEAGTQQALSGLKLGEQTQEASTLTDGYLILARLKQVQGDDEGTQDALQKARSAARRYAGLRYLTTLVEAFQAQLWLEQGNLRATINWFQNAGLQLNPLPATVPYLQEKVYLVLVRLLLAQAQQTNIEWPLPVVASIETALTLLTRIIEAASQSKRMECVLEALALQALAFQLQNNRAETINTVHYMFTLAEPEGYVRLFIAEGQAMYDLLNQSEVKSLAPKYSAKILTIFRQALKPTTTQSPLLLDPLSERELEILSLIATGMSNKELAAELVLTVGTVKWHLNNIYSKLAVRSRTQAVAQSRELGLI